MKNLIELTYQYSDVNSDDKRNGKKELDEALDKTVLLVLFFFSHSSKFNQLSFLFNYL